MVNDRIAKMYFQRSKDHIERQSPSRTPPPARLPASASALDM